MRTLGLCAIFLGICAAPATPQGPAPLRGYAATSAVTERDWEQKLRAMPDTANLRSYMERLSARPHHVGSPYDKDNAEWILSKLDRKSTRLNSSHLGISYAVFCLK